jgi:hypothetical protein
VYLSAVGQPHWSVVRVPSGQWERTIENAIAASEVAMMAKSVVMSWPLTTLVVVAGAQPGLVTPASARRAIQMSVVHNAAPGARSDEAQLVRDVAVIDAASRTHRP